MYHKPALIYIYATVNVNNIDWYLVGPDRWIPAEYISLLNIPRRPDGVTGRWIALDLSQQTLIAFDGDTPIFATLISAANRGFGVTRPGLFHIYARTRGMIFRGPPWKAVPDYIIDHVPNVMFFDGNIALHGAYWHDKFGIPLTHGCVNVPVGDEEWLGLGERDVQSVGPCAKFSSRTRKGPVCVSLSQQQILTPTGIIGAAGRPLIPSHGGGDFPGHSFCLKHLSTW
jgi:hypothetical protein